MTEHLHDPFEESATDGCPFCVAADPDDQGWLEAHERFIAAAEAYNRDDWEAFRLLCEQPTDPVEYHHVLELFLTLLEFQREMAGVDNALGYLRSGIKAMRSPEVPS